MRCRYVLFQSIKHSFSIGIAAVLTALMLCSGGCTVASSPVDTAHAPVSAESEVTSSPHANGNDEAYLEQCLKYLNIPSAGDTYAAENEIAAIETSHVSNGFFFVILKAQPESKLKLQVSINEKLYYYDLSYDTPIESFPLQNGNGKYQLAIYQNVEGNRYAMLLSASVSVTLTDSMSPFLVPNQYISYSKESKAVSRGFLLTKECTSQLEKVKVLFEYVSTSIEYDNKKASSVTEGYLPDIDETLSSGNGICFDYSALLAAMLRSQGIPTKLVTGYVQPQNQYHAWNMVYMSEPGVISDGISTAGNEWLLLDATLTAAGEADGAEYYAINEY